VWAAINYLIFPIVNGFDLSVIEFSRTNLSGFKKVERFLSGTLGLALGSLDFLANRHRSVCLTWG